ncbi:MAG: hypothetical protein IPO86_00690 [Saprospiraceae bacterium]|nr:hypothetical protein [Saprospiraceae bacterium]MBK9726611.1 hypothetical protein [Saprospiraceae bacterium]
MIKASLLLSFMVLANATDAQQISTIQISFTYGSKVLSMDDSLNQSNDSSVLRITQLKFYISKIKFLNHGKVVMEENNSFHLVDASQINSLQILIDNKQNIPFDELKFNLGLDSTTNVSGALGGDLDPTKGMYWTWQSGYINFKLEGKSNVCKTRNNEFAFHLGGYQQPYYGLQTLSFPLNNTNRIHLNLDVLEIIKEINLTKTNHIMSPSAEAVMLSKIVANAFTLSKN